LTKEEALELFKQEVCFKSNQIDFYQERDWNDLSYGFFLAKGFSPSDAEDLAIKARYTFQYWENEKVFKEIFVDLDFYHFTDGHPSISEKLVKELQLKQGEEIKAFNEDEEWIGVVRYDESLPEIHQWYIELLGYDNT